MIVAHSRSPTGQQKSFDKKRVTRTAVGRIPTINRATAGHAPPTKKKTDSGVSVYARYPFSQSVTAKHSLACVPPHTPPS